MLNSGGVDSVSYHLQPHVALLPSAGMGHLTPCLRLAASLVRHDCRVTLITSHPAVSVAESRSISSFLSAFPQVTEKQFHLLPLDPTSVNSDDPFLLQWEAINRSVHLLPPLLSSISPISAFVTDVTLVSSVVPLTTNLGVPNYILFVSSARMCSFFMSFPTFVASKTTSGFVTFGNNKDVEIPISSIPPPLLNLNHPFATSFLQNARGAMKSTGVLINTFEALEGDILHALNDTRLIDGFPPLHAIGPLPPGEFEKGEDTAAVKWLDDQPDGSVVYVSFGNRSAVSREQMKELGNGLVRSGCKFLWVAKDKKVDKEDGESLDELLGSELMERIENHGLVVKTWVDQNEILSHRGVGGFLSHCGWNSILEAAWHGVRVLMWPLGGDQRINAQVVERSGLGIWVKSWGWNDQQVVIKAEEIEQGIKDMMEGNQLKIQAANMKEEARKAVGIGGSSERTLKGLIEEWKKNETYVKNIII